MVAFKNISIFYVVLHSIFFSDHLCVRITTVPCKVLVVQLQIRHHPLQMSTFGPIFSRFVYMAPLKKVKVRAPLNVMSSRSPQTTVVLVRQLYTRDTRRQFCPDNHWINDRITLPPMDHRGVGNDLSLRRSRLRQYRPFQV